MHRETYYLAVDFLDRYLSMQRGVVKSQLQLIGITCLFIASKVEEIYPPKLTEFAYVTDGACQTEQIIEKELIILKTLNWNLSSVTVHAWLNLFTQICNNTSATGSQPTTITSSNHSFVFPNHSVKEYLQSAQLLDLSVLDEGSLRYSYSVLAASSIYLTSYKDQILSASGLQWSDIADCVEWMSAFAQALKDEKSPHSPIRVVSNNNSEDSYLIQTHTVDLTLLDKGQAKLQSKLLDIASPAHHSSVILLTPPSSSKKPN